MISRSEQLEAFPHSGRRVPEYKRDDVRELTERPYWLIYRVSEDRLDAITVTHGRRQLPEKFEDL
jgi:plasmid stabilization system protein ParE